MRPIPKEAARLDYLHYFRRDHLLPGRISRLQFVERIRGIDSEIFRIVVRHLVDEVVIDQVAKEREQVGRDLCVGRSAQLS